MTEADVVRETHEHVQNVQILMAAAMREIVGRAAVHDASKFKEPEFATFCEFTPKLKGCTYGSEEYRDYLEAMKPALEHHYRANPHHPEHFPDGYWDMSLIDLLEMLCDWIAATLRHDDGDIRRSIEQNQGRFGYSNDLKQILHNTAARLRPSSYESPCDTKGGE